MNPATFLFADSVRLFVQLVLPILGGCAVGAILACVLQFALQLDERGLSFLARFTGVAVALFLSFDTISTALLQFTMAAWGGASVGP